MNKDKLYLDCNIILDWIVDRPPFSSDAVYLINMIEKGEVAGFVSPLVLANCYYILVKTLNKEIAAEFIKDSYTIFEIVDNTKFAVVSSIENSFRDFEDDLHYYSAINNKLDYLITRNKKDFRKKSIKIRTAEEYLLERES